MSSVVAKASIGVALSGWRRDGARQLTNFNLDLHVAVHSQAIGLSEVPASTCHEALRFHLEGSPMTPGGKPKSNPSQTDLLHHLFIPP